MPDAVARLLTLAIEFAAIFLAVSFVVHLLVQSVPAARLRQLLSGNPVRSTALALVVGAITPFCSCSTVPVVAGMASAGVSVTALTAFLVVSPLVNPATIALLATLTTPLHALGFVVLSMLMALAVAGAMAALRITPTLPTTLLPASSSPGATTPWLVRLRGAAARSALDLRRVAPLLLAVAAVGALLHGRVDAGVVGGLIDAAGPWAVPVAVLIGVPVYASTAVLLPLGSVLLATGANLGVVAAFLIGATGLSLPEGLMLHRLLGGRYLTTLALSFVAAAITLGYVVQALWPTLAPAT
jgi:uncharacterized protein